MKHNTIHIGSNTKYMKYKLDINSNLWKGEVGVCGQHRLKHVVVSITVIKYTSVIKLCLTTYLLLVSHTQRG